MILRVHFLRCRSPQMVMVFVLAVLCALWAWPADAQDTTPAPRTNGELLLRATFQKGMDGFEPAYGAEWMEVDAQDGVAEVRALGADTSVVAVLPTATFKDFAAEVDIRPLTQRTGEDFGLFFRSDSLENNLSYYYAVSFVPAEGMAYLDIWQDATEWDTIEEVAIPPGVLDAGGFNRLRLEAVGDEFTLFLNDVFLLRAVDETLSEPGIIGMFVSAAEDLVADEKAVGQFDDLSVYAVGAPKSSRQAKPAVSAPSSKASEPQSFADDFSDPDSGWWTGDDDDGMVRYADGELVIRNYTDAGNRTESTPGIAAADVVVEVEGRLADGTANNWQTAFCRDRGGNGYSFGYSADGYFTANIWIDGERVREQEPTATDAVRQGKDAVNAVKVSCVGPRLQSWVNGTLLVDWEDDRLTEGEFGVAVTSLEGEFSEVAFDNFSATGTLASTGATGAAKVTEAEPAAAPAVTPPEPQSAKGLPLYDDFGASASGWEIADEAAGSVSYRNGELVIRDNTSDDSPASATPRIVADDVVIEVESRHVGGTDDNWQIIFCRRQGTNDYAFAYRTDGYFAANLWIDDETVRQVDVTETDAIRQGSDAVNAAKVACVDNRLQFWINGTLLVDWEDDSLREGEFGLAAQAMSGDYTEIAFDNFVATGTLTPAATAKAAPAPAAGTSEMAATVTAASLNVRAGPGASYARVDSVAQGEILAVTGRNAACSWVQVVTPRVEGWVSAGYVRLNVSCDAIPLVGQAVAPVVEETPAGGTVVAVEPAAAAGTNVVTDFESFGNWRRGDETWGTFTQSRAEAYGGSAAGKIEYDFPANVPGDRNYVVFMRSLPIPGRPDRLQLQVYGDGSGNFLNVWVKDAAGQVWQFPFGQIKHIGWKQMSAPLDIGGKWPVQIIDGDGKPLQYPLQFQALVLDYPTSDAASGVVYVDDLRAVTP